MKKDLNNIENIFKEAFDGFEANVDPSVWNNIQSNIGGTTGAGSAMSKAMLTKAVLGVAIVAGIASSTYYFIANENSKKTDNVVIENTISQDQESISQDEILEENYIRSSEIQVENGEKISATSTPDSEIEKISNKEKIIKVNAEKSQFVSESNIVETPTSIQSNTAQTEKSNIQDNTKKSQNVVAEQVNLNVIIKSSTVKGKAPLDVEFNVDGNGVAYSWDFGDGSEITSQENSFHTFTKPGKYIVKLTGIDKNANAKTVVQVITVEAAISSSLSPVPTVFSPNGDGINDIIKIDGEHIGKFRAVVRDAKGNVVFEWNSLEGFWDGRDLNYQILPKGTYYIVVVAIGEDGENHTVQQTLQLF